jgi:sec-independent protein translocase protein TatA
MFGLRMPELLLILAIVVLLFGANKLPQLGAGLGQSIRDFKKALQGDGGKEQGAGGPGAPGASGQGAPKA